MYLRIHFDPLDFTALCAQRFQTESRRYFLLINFVSL